MCDIVLTLRLLYLWRVQIYVLPNLKEYYIFLPMQERNISHWPPQSNWHRMHVEGKGELGCKLWWPSPPTRLLPCEGSATETLRGRSCQRVAGATDESLSRKRSGKAQVWFILCPLVVSATLSMQIYFFLQQEAAAADWSCDVSFHGSNTVEVIHWNYVPTFRNQDAEPLSANAQIVIESVGGSEIMDKLSVHEVAANISEDDTTYYLGNVVVCDETAKNILISTASNREVWLNNRRMRVTGILWLFYYSAKTR